MCVWRGRGLWEKQVKFSKLSFDWCQHRAVPVNGENNSVGQFLKRNQDLFFSSQRGTGVKTDPGTGRKRLINQSLH